MRKLRKRAQAFVDSERYPARGDRAVALTNEIANALEILDCGFGPAEALAGIPAVDQRADVGVFDELAPLGGGKARFNFADKPFIVACEALNGLENKGFSISPLLRRYSGKLALELGRKM